MMLHWIGAAASVAWTVATLAYVCVKRLPDDDDDDAQCSARFCLSNLRLVRCEREEGHPGLHTSGSETAAGGSTVWGSTYA